MIALLRRLPLARQLAGSDRSALWGDLSAGLSTAVMLIPQAMAYAMLAGLEPIAGLYASTVPLAVYGLLGTSRQLAVGPVAMVSLLVASGVSPLAGGDPVRFATLAAALAGLVGLIQWGMGLARLGVLVKFLSHPVIAGFTSAAALIIGLSQLKHLLGVPIPRSHHVHAILASALAQADAIHPLTLALGLGTIALLLGLKRWAPRLPRFLVVVVGGTLLVWAFGLDARGVAVVGEVPRGLPTPVVPWAPLEDLLALGPVALTIALVGFMESISVARRFARENGYAVDADQELRALGLANLAGSLLQAYPVTGGFSRTAVNAQAGARTGLASVITALVVVLTLLFLTPLFTLLPKAVLAGIITTAVFGLVAVDEVRHLWRVSRPDLAVMGLTFAATLVLGIEPGIAVGVGASLLGFLWRTSRPHVAVLGRVPGTTLYRNRARHPEARTPEGVVAIRVDAPLYFANTAFLEQAVAEAIGQAPIRQLVLDGSAIGSVDAQGLASLASIVEDLRAKGIGVWLAAFRGPVRDAFEASGLLERLGADRLVDRVHTAVQRAADQIASEVAPSGTGIGGPSGAPGGCTEIDSSRTRPRPNTIGSAVCE